MLPIRPWMHDRYTAFELSSGCPSYRATQWQKQMYLGNSHSGQPARQLSKTQCDGMAAKLNRYLVCFYCGSKSKSKQDGTVREWDCTKCEATNYLDENGDITDPPVATTSTSPNVSFAKPIPPPGWSAAAAQDPVFCQTCVKNQHLYRSSLAQYLPDPSHPEYDNLVRNLENFKTELEDRYPQVCETCVDRVQHRMKRAVYGAKADAHGRMLERTKRAKGSHFRKPRTWLELAQDWGHTAWAWGLYIQMAYYALLLIQGFRPALHSPVEDDSIDSDMSGHDDTTTTMLQMLKMFATSVIFSIPDTFQPVMRELVATSLMLSIGSLWWNPQWKFTTKQNLHTVLGLQDWYSEQGLLLLLRLTLWYGNGSWAFLTEQSMKTMAIHAFMLAFTFRIWTSTTRKVTVKPKKLFSAAPDRMSLISKKRTRVSPQRGINSLMDALDSIDDGPTVPSSPVTPKTASVAGTPLTKSTVAFTPLTSRDTQRTPPSARTMDGSSPLARLSMNTLQNNTMPRSDPDEMEWTPTQSQHRAFQPDVMARRDGQSFNRAPPAPEHSPFWYKVPQAPMTPARILRNPVTKPIMQVPSAEAKENFFRKMTTASNSNTTPLGSSKIRKEYKFAQPKFFPPGAAEDDTGLADAFNRSFKLEEDGSAQETKDRVGEWKEKGASTLSGASNTVVWIALGVILWVWNLAFTRPTQYSASITFASMIGCSLIGLRSLVDNGLAIAGKSPRLSNYFGAVAAAVETGAALHIMVALRPGLGGDETGRYEGTALLCFMIAHAITGQQA